MPRQKSLLTAIRDLVRKEVSSAMQALLNLGARERKASNGRRRRRKAGGKWRPGGPGRPPKAAGAKTARRK